jgi:hypothetical protein
MKRKIATTGQDEDSERFFSDGFVYYRDQISERSTLRGAENMPKMGSTL